MRRCLERFSEVNIIHRLFVPVVASHLGVAVYATHPDNLRIGVFSAIVTCAKAALARPCSAVLLLIYRQ